jgi:glycosyltransferase involved in cell wall biosynthesis
VSGDLEVTVNARHLAGPRTGIEVYMERLLIALAETGQVRLTAVSWSPLGIERENLREVVPALRPAFASGRLGELRALLWKTWFDQWQCVRGVAPGAGMLFHGMDGFLPWGVRRRDRCVVTVHDLGWQVHPELYPRKLRVMYGALFPWVVRRADRIIAVSRHTADDLMRRAGVPASRIEVIHHGLDPEFAAEPDGAPATARSTGTEPPYLLAVGGVSPRKNTRRLIEAFARWRARGGYRAAYGLRVSGISLDPEFQGGGAPLTQGVSLLGYVDKAELRRQYAGAAAFLYPSVYEGFGLPIIEAMASGTPVLTSRTASAPEIAGEAAVLVDPFSVESIESGLEEVTNPEVAGRLRELGRERARRFQWSSAAARTIEVYRELAAHL